ncbi:efflux RND transporter periplasmic adaptor subunit [Orrella sp. NBD-18]|uniref:Efflux RND transporter periplasmic adaptor subunit n=1 Tax=Sheuella amnicola TaxID=2707330 RepID=A0A6B2QVT3_9BURK|nr:efflux RND transporter periplasmic adaptor subunit [Sheuella amnicola]NDY81758.1 efflux RND transporter periplasmic adaptor subunit [Sheuella amnicola]
MSTTFTQPLIRSFMTGCMVVAAIALAGCEKKAPPASPPPAVTVAKPLVQEVRNYELFDGNVAALLSVNLEARVPGYLDKIEFKDGTYVKKDQLLFVIEQDQYLQQVNLTQAIYNEAKIEIARQKSLLKDNATSQASVDKATSSFLQAEANLKLAKINYGYTEVRAPFDGLMGRHLIDVGNYLGSSPSGVKLATIQKINPIYVYFSINERDLLKFQKQYVNSETRKKQDSKVPVRVALQDEKGFPHAGMLDFSANLLSTDTGSLQLRAELPNDNYQLLPGLYAKVKIEYGDARQGILIPTSSLQTDQQGFYVYVVDADKKVNRHNVSTGQKFANLTEITQGLKETDLVIVNGFINVRSGQVVNPTTTNIDPLPKN